MYPSTSNFGGGERRSSYQHYAMSQVNNQPPIVEREQDEHVEPWGRPSSSPSYPGNLSPDRGQSFSNRLTSSSSSLFDRNNPRFNDLTSTGGDGIYQQQQQQAFTSQHRIGGQTAMPITNAMRQHQTTSSSSFSQRASNMSNAPGAHHFHDVPYFHGFKFQAMPGSLTPMRAIDSHSIVIFVFSLL